VSAGKCLRLVLLFVVVFAFGGASALGRCPEFYGGRKIGSLESPLIREASGLAASRKNKGVLWIHNDRGDAPRVFAMSTQGRHLGVFRLKGARAQDWEDIAIGPGPEAGTDYLYIADIGDNDAKRNSIVVYRVAEPNVDVNEQGGKVVLEGAQAIKLKYPDAAHNAETLMVDPLTKDIYIATKEGTTRVYRAAYPQSTDDVTTMEFAAELSFGMAVGGDISPAGDLVVIRGYFAASLWVRDNRVPLHKVFESDKCNVPLVLERQGEAIAFDGEGQGYYTVSEKKHQPIYYFARKSKQ